MQFQFDPAKAQSNLRKHKVSFADAEGVFFDSQAIHIEDMDSAEERYVALGMCNIGQILVVIYTFRGEQIRLISARKATKHEVQSYAG